MKGEVISLTKSHDEIDKIVKSDLFKKLFKEQIKKNDEELKKAQEEKEKKNEND